MSLKNNLNHFVNTFRARRIYTIQKRKPNSQETCSNKFGLNIKKRTIAADFLKLPTKKNQFFYKNK